MNKRKGKRRKKGWRNYDKVRRKKDKEDLKSNKKRLIDKKKKEKREFKMKLSERNYWKNN